MKTIKFRTRSLCSIALLTICTFFFDSYGQQIEVADENKINILEAKKIELNISEIAEEIQYVPLSNNELIGVIIKCKYFDGNYYVQENTPKFYRFDENGKFLNQIGRPGRGPGEYMYIPDFTVHPDKGNIFFNGKPGQLMVYSPKGRFLNSIKLTHNSVDVIGVNEANLFCVYSPDMVHVDNNMELIDIKGNNIKSYTNKYEFERGGGVMGFRNENIMYQMANQLYFKEIFSDTIFTLDGENMTPHFILNSGKHRFTPEIRSEMMASSRGNQDKIQAQCVIQNNLFESGNYLFYEYLFDNVTQTLIWNKTTGESLEINSETGIINDFDGGLNIQNPSKKDGSSIFMIIDAYKLIAHVNSDEFKISTPKYPEKKKELEQLANSLAENDNPVLMLVKLKE